MPRCLSFLFTAILVGVKWGLVVVAGDLDHLFRCSLVIFISLDEGRRLLKALNVLDDKVNETICLWCFDIRTERKKNTCCFIHLHSQ